MFILNLFILSLNSFFLTGIFNIESWCEFFSIFIIFFYSQILGISIILGLLNLLYPKYIILSFLLILVLILPFIKKIKIPEIKGIDKKISVILSIGFSAHILHILTIFLLPPLTTDGLLYHLPFAVHYYKTHSISLPNLYFTDIGMTYYPIGGEIFYLFSLLSEKEFLFKYTQFPFLILGSLSLFLISKSFGLSDFLSVVSALCFSLVKPIFNESSMCFVDLIMAGTFISSIYFFKKKERKYIPIGILSLSILLSVKTLSIIFAILTLPFLFEKKEGRYTKLFYFSILYLLSFGLFSYWKNFLLTGNPFYPAETKIANFVLFKGAYIYPKIPILNKIKNLFHILIFSSLHIDPSLNLKILLFLFFLISFILSLKIKKLLLFNLIFPISIFLYCFLVPPYYYQIRHLLPIYGILCFSLIYPFKRFEYFCIPIFLYICFSVIKYIFLPRLFIIFFILAIPFYFASHFKKRILYLFYFLFFIIFLIFEIFKTDLFYEKTKFMFWKAFYKEEGEIWEFVQKNSKDGKNIAYVGCFFIYPFYGNKFQNNVFYQSVNSIETLPVFKYKEKIEFPGKDVENLYRKNPSYKLWIFGLKNKKIDWIIIKKDKDYIEKNWIEKNNEIFKLIFSNDYAEIYEILF
ncbi:MAG: hypothetical protein NC833_00540 [Candidatus Omnitrophica bacterium]|nr:hypothetical protein [Candidatus Omnitrophota bacterium]